MTKIILDSVCLAGQSVTGARGRTYLANKGREILMLEYNGQDLLGELGLVENVEGAARVGPAHNILLSLILNQH